MGKPVFPSGADFNNQQVTGLADGSAATDAVTLQQLQAMVRGLNWKEEVRAASTANVTLASPGTTLDGVTLAANDRVLLKNQSAAAENGIYVWTASGSALTRALDADSAAELLQATTSVMEGTTNADTTWVLTTNAPITVNTTSLTFAAFGGSGFTTAGTGLTASGGTVNAIGGTGIIANADDIAIDTAVVARYAWFACGTSATWTMTHSFNSRRVAVDVYLASDGTPQFPSLVRNLNDVTVTLPSAPSSGQYEAVITRAN